MRRGAKNSAVGPISMSSIREICAELMSTVEEMAGKD